jgi:hypothetical protein
LAKLWSKLADFRSQAARGDDLIAAMTSLMSAGRAKRLIVT